MTLRLPTLIVALLLLAGCGPVPAELVPATVAASPTLLPVTSVPGAAHKNEEDNDLEPAEPFSESLAFLDVTCRESMDGCQGEEIQYVGAALPDVDAYMRARHRGEGRFRVSLRYKDGRETNLIDVEGDFQGEGYFIRVDGLESVVVFASGPWSLTYYRGSR